MNHEEISPATTTEPPPGDDTALAINRLAKTVARLEKRINAMVAPQKDYLSRPEVCALLGIDQSTLNRLETKKDVPPRYQVSGTPKYRREDIDAWMLTRPYKGKAK